MKTASKIFTVAVFIFLYVPMLVLIIASFNSGADLVVFKGFTMDNYQSLFRDRVLLPLLLNSVIISVIASLVSTVLGTAATLGILHHLLQRPGAFPLLLSAIHRKPAPRHLRPGGDPHPPDRAPAGRVGRAVIRRGQLQTRKGT